MSPEEMILASGRDPVDEARRTDDATAAAKLAEKRFKRNFYMRSYRQHIKTLPTFASLTRYRGSKLNFTARDGSPANAQLTVDNKLIIQIDYDKDFQHEVIYDLPSNSSPEVKKMLKDAIALAYDNVPLAPVLIRS
jgi:hypothetical protein